MIIRIAGRDLQRLGNLSGRRKIHVGNSDDIGVLDGGNEIVRMKTTDTTGADNANSEFFHK